MFVLYHCVLEISVGPLRFVKEGFCGPWYARGGFMQSVLTSMLLSKLETQVDKETVVARDGQHIELECLKSHIDIPRAVILVCHGIDGAGAKAPYLRPWGTIAQKQGFHVIVYNRRGYAQPLTSTSTRHPSYADPEDMTDVLEYIRRRYGKAMPIIGIGYSAGGIQVMKAIPFGMMHGVIGISTCYDITKMIPHLKKTSWCNTYLGGFLSRFVRKNEEFYKKPIVMFPDGLCMDTYRAEQQGLSIEEYYAMQSSIKEIEHSNIPVLCIMAKNDPIFPVLETLKDLEKIAEKNYNVTVCATDCGGHLGWIDRHHECWLYENTILPFIQEILLDVRVQLQDVRVHLQV